MNPTRQTAYSFDWTAGPGRSGDLIGWDPKIADLVDLGHRFLGFEYSEPGWLFRGGSSGLSDVLSSGEIGRFEGEKSVTLLELQLGIYFISQDFSDSYAVARFWERARDNYIAVFKSSCFNRELNQGKAAVLGFAEPGVVFKYPFLTRPLALSDVDFLIVSPEQHALLGSTERKRGSVADHGQSAAEGWPERPAANCPKIISPAIRPEASSRRASYEKALVDLLERRGINSAFARPSPKFPKAV